MKKTYREAIREAKAILEKHRIESADKNTIIDHYIDDIGGNGQTNNPGFEWIVSDLILEEPIVLDEITYKEGVYKYKDGVISHKENLWWYKDYVGKALGDKENYFTIDRSNIGKLITEFPTKTEEHTIDSVRMELIQDMYDSMIDYIPDNRKKLFERKLLIIKNLEATKDKD